MAKIIPIKNATKDAIMAGSPVNRLRTKVVRPPQVSSDLSRFAGNASTGQSRKNKNGEKYIFKTFISLIEFWELVIKETKYTQYNILINTVKI